MERSEELVGTIVPEPIKGRGLKVLVIGRVEIGDDSGPGFLVGLSPTEVYLAPEDRIQRGQTFCYVSMLDIEKIPREVCRFFPYSSLFASF